MFLTMKNKKGQDIYGQDSCIFEKCLVSAGSCGVMLGVHGVSGMGGVAVSGVLFRA